MEKSMYFELVEKYFPGLVLQIVEKINDSNNALSYLYRDLLTKQYSADARWASVLANYTRVAADVVSLDSELPLKARDTVESASGEIPKIGMKLYLTEKQMKDIDSMISLNLPIGTIINTLFADLPRVITGVYERIEDLFLSEFSTGVGLATRNNGTGIRVNVGYKPENHFECLAGVWASAPDTATPIDDIQQIFDKALADGNTITDVYADDHALRAMYKSKQVRESYAFAVGFVGTNVPTLNLEQLSTVFMTTWGVTLHRVARKVRTELNGAQEAHSPWAQGRLVFVCDATVGSLVWTNCAEAAPQRRVNGVVYQIVDDFILASRYSKNDPLREITSSQAMVVPIVNNVDRIYTFDSTTLHAG